MRPGLWVAACLTALCAVATAAEKETTAIPTDELGLQLAREKEVLRQLQKRLEAAEAQAQGSYDEYRRGRLKESLKSRPLNEAPSIVTSEGFRLERTDGEAGPTYTVSAVNAPAIQVFEAVAKTSAVQLELHPDVGRSSLLGRVSLDLKGVDAAELLQIVAGMQSLGVMVDDTGIVVAPLTALSSAPLEKVLQEMAVEAYQNALLRFPLSPHAPGAYLGIARYYASAGFNEAALQAVQNVLERYPQSEAAGPALILLGDCHQRLGRYDAARNAYYRYVDNFPAAKDLPEVLMKIANTWTAEDKWDQAAPVLEGLLREWPNSAEAPYARMRLAECLAKQGHYEHAIEQLRLIEKAHTRFARQDELNLVLAECLVKLKKFGAARVHLKKVAETSSDLAMAEKACYAIGDTFLAESQPLAAVEMYLAAIRSFPQGQLRATAPLRLSRAYQQMGLHVLAEKELASLKELPADAEEVKSLVLAQTQYFLEIGNTNRALAFIKSLPWKHDSNTDPDILLLCAKAYLLLGKPAEALENAVAASHLAKDDLIRAEAARIVGDCRMMLKEQTYAAMAYGGKVE